MATTQLDQLLQVLRARGVEDPEGNDLSQTLSGTFRIYEGEAYFEIVADDLAET